MLLFMSELAVIIKKNLSSRSAHNTNCYVFKRHSWKNTVQNGNDGKYVGYILLTLIPVD